MDGNNGFPNFQNEPPRCPKCGAPVNDGAMFCGNCGMMLKVVKQETDVLSVWDYILMMVLFSLPLVGLVMMLLWGFGSQVKVNRKNFARAYLAFYLISMLISMLALGAIGSLTAAVFESGTASLF